MSVRGLLHAADYAADQHRMMAANRAPAPPGVTMIAVALSVSTQQSSRCNGLQMIRLFNTSSTESTRFL